MKKYNDGLCSIQEYIQFKTRIFDAVDEWLNYCDADPELGIAIEQATLDVEVCNKEEAQTREWFPLETLATDGEADADAVLDLADQFCFVR